MQRVSMKNFLFPSFLVACVLSSSAWAQSTENAEIRVTGRITGATCSLQTSSIVIRIGDVDKSTFQGVGTHSPYSPDVALISAGCDASLVSMTFSGTADADDPTLFAVTGGAKGVGIRLAKTGGSAFAVPNDTSKPVTFAPAAAGQGYSFAARYEQTLDSITTGAANATITVLITYT